MGETMKQKETKKQTNDYKNYFNITTRRIKKKQAKQVKGGLTL